MSQSLANAMPAPRLELRGICKRFAEVVANEDISLVVQPGEIHAIMGENGAGKSTLVKMIYGLIRPDAGQILWLGQPISINSPKAARRLGIGMVLQHFSLFDALTILENITLVLEGGLTGRQLRERIVGVMDAYGLPLDLERRLGDLSVGERQRVEVVRALMFRPELLIMDEPTSVLAPSEVEQLFAVLRKLASEGTSILYISHKLDEIKALCGRATILRAGRYVGTYDPAQESARTLAERMIGSDLRTVARSETVPGQARLTVQDLATSFDPTSGLPLRDVSFTVRAGEIFGIGGIAGNGQTALHGVLSGEVAATSGTIALDGQLLVAADPAARRRKGLRAVPEERNGHAAVGGMSLLDNTVLTTWSGVGVVRNGLILRASAETATARIIEHFGVKTTGTDSHAHTLSGGNLQKFVLGREILQAPDVLVVSQPTWGVDAHAATTIHQALVDLAAQGAAIVIISQNLDELMAICSSFAVLNAGRLSPARKRGEVSVAEIGLLIAGSNDRPEVKDVHAH